jgi:hypothetical protein
MSEPISIGSDSVEQWRPIPGWEGWYSISNHGRVRREMRMKGTLVGKILKASPDRKGYLYFNLRRPGTKKRMYAHIAVAVAFIGPCPIGHEVNHINGVPMDNHASNLEYLTHLENMRHAFRTGLKKNFDYCKGEDNPAAKLTAANVIEIRKLFAAGWTLARVAARFSVTSTTACDIRKGKSWKSVV